MSRGGRREGAGRKSTWKNRDTTVIRVPKVFAEQLLEIAQKLDSGDKIEFVSKSKDKTIDKVTKSKKKDESVTQSKNEQLELVTDSKEGISGRQLSKRLGVDSRTLRRHRDGIHHESLEEWSKSRDPEGKAWEYQEDGKYYLVS